VADLVSGAMDGADGSLLFFVDGEDRGDEWRRRAGWRP
jgi:hypothetical protein